MGSQQDGNLDPGRILTTSRAFMSAMPLCVATKLDIFSAIQRRCGSEGLTLEEISKECGLLAFEGFRGTADFLDLLVCQDFLHRTGDGQAAHYHNTAETAAFLVKDSPMYVGAGVLMSISRLYWLWGHLEDALTKGEVPPGTVPSPAEIFDGGDVGFALAMQALGKARFAGFAQKFDFKPYKTLADVGGCTGCLAVCVAEAQPHMNLLTVDLPSMHQTAQAYVDEQGVADRVKVVDVDFFESATLPKADIITMAKVLHDWGAEKKRMLVRKAFEALPVGGAFVAIDEVIDDERRTHTSGLQLSLNMLLEFGKENSSEYTFKEFKEWTTEAGFVRFDLVRLVAGSYAAIAYK